MSYKINGVNLDSPNEVNTLPEKVAPVAGDVVIIEDSADGNRKKKVQIGNLGVVGPQGPQGPPGPPGSTFSTLPQFLRAVATLVTPSLDQFPAYP